ncbi:MAG: HesA/MoeB/ThiF family protein [Anaerolineales bacterium]|nr:HesA/MoeB/ThiF family protein [Anaerolineales bacterium]
MAISKDPLDEHEKNRYDRQMLIDGWGEVGQQRLKSATVFVAGAGGLGSPVSIYLAVAGVGKIIICDADVVELSNLNRQILHPEERVSEQKAESAGKSLTALNPGVKIVPFAEYLNQDNIETILARPDLIVDCLDNFETRYLLNRYAIKQGIPFVHGAVWGMMGQLTFLQSPQTPCLRCIFPKTPPKQVFPVVGAAPGVIGCMQAMEALKFLTGIGTTLKGRLLIFDGEDMSYTSLDVRRVPSCPECGGDS